MKSKTSMITSLVLLGLSAVSVLAGAGRPARAVDMIGFSKRQNGWIGGAALHATGCPKDLQDCGNDKAQNWCCPKDTVCKVDYCCPTGLPPQTDRSVFFLFFLFLTADL